MTNKELKRQAFLEATRNRERKLEEKVLGIAKKHSYAVEERGDLDRRGSDLEDFIELSVWSLKEMLKEAYESGKLNR